MIYKKTAKDRIFDIFLAIIMILVVIITLYPLIYVISMSISDPIEAAKGNVVLFPKGFSLEALSRVLNDSDILLYYGNTIWYTVVGVVLGILTTCLMAYPLSRPEFYHRSIVNRFIMVTMFFGGGLIPSYIVVTKFLGLYNSRWAIILTGLTACWYIIVARAYFESLPGDIIESARIDGASEYGIFFRIVMPVSKPILAVLALYFAVAKWNSYFPALIYLSDEKLQPLALYIRSVVIQNSVSSFTDAGARITAEQVLSGVQIKYAVIVISVLPLLLIYPFISGNLEKGLMVGAVKG